MNLQQLRQLAGGLNNLTDEEILRAVAQVNGVDPDQDPRYRKMADEFAGYNRGAFDRFVRDPAVGLVRGVVGIGQTGAMLAGAAGGAAAGGADGALYEAFNNPAYSALNAAGDAVDRWKSPGLRAQEAAANINADIAVRDAAAQGASMPGRLWAGVKAQGGNYLQNPGLAVQDFVQSAPTLMAGGLVGRGLQMGGEALGAGTRLAAGIGTAGGIGANAVLQGGDVAGDTYDRMIQAGADPDTAARESAIAGAKGGAATLALAAVPGATTIERSLLKNVGRPGGLRGAARGFGGEFAQEFTEEGYGRFAGNQAVQTVDPNTDLMSGVGQAALQGGIGAGPLGGLHGARHHAVAPRTETGELDLTGGTPTRTDPLMGPPKNVPQPDIPVSLRNPDTLPEFLRADTRPTMADVANPAIDPTGGPATMADLVRSDNLPSNPFDTSNFASAPARPEVVSAAFSPVDARPAPVSDANPPVMIAGREGVLPPTMLPAAPEQRPAAVTAQTERARVLSQANAALGGSTQPNVGQLLESAQRANTALGLKVVRKDGELANTAGAAPMREVLQSKDPLGTIRSLYQDGKHPRDEFLDRWHQELTGQTIDERKAGQATLNTAGFVTEPLPQVNAQLRALRQGRKEVVVLPVEQRDQVDLKGLSVGVATGTDGARAVVVSRDKAKVKQAVARAKEVGLKQAMGEAQGVANPTLTANPQEGTATMQQRDQSTGHVLAEEVVTPQDVPNVRPVPGTTQTVVPNAQPIAERVAGGVPVQQLAPKKPSLAERKASARADGVGAAMDGNGLDANPHKQGTAAFKEWVEGHAEVTERAAAERDTVGQRGSAKQLIEIVETAKNEQTYNDALFELYKLAADGNVNAYNYFVREGYYDDISTNPRKLKPQQAAEMKMLRERWQTEQGQQRGRKFGATKFRERGKPEQTVDKFALQTMVANVRRALPNAPAIEVYDSPSDVGLQAPGGTASGVMYVADDGRHHLALFRDGIASTLEAAQTAFHELFHYALNGIFTGEAYHQLMDTAAQDPHVRELAGRWWDDNAANYRRSFPDMSRRDLQSRAIEEALAQVSEELVANGGSKPGLVRHLAKWMAEIADRMGLGELATWLQRAAMTDIEKFVTDVLRTLAGNDPAPNGGGHELAPAFRGEPPKFRDVPALKPLGDGAKAMVAAAKAHTEGHVVSEKLLNVLTLRQIAEQYGSKLPALRDWAETIFERGGKAYKLAAEADRLAQRWAALKSETQKSLAEVLLRASNAELHLDDTSREYLAKLDPKDRVEYNALRAKLEALPPEAKQIRKDALATLTAQWKQTHEALRSFIAATISDPGVRAERMKELDAEFGRSRGDYFPLSRFGKWVVIGRGAAADGRDVVTFHETTHAAEEEKRRLQDAGVKHIVVTADTEYNPREHASSGFIHAMNEAIDQHASGAEAKALHEALQQLFLKSLPELSGAKHMIRRENIEGYSQNALRAFADAVTRGARYAAHLEFAPAMHAAMEAAEAQSRSSDMRRAALVIGRKDGAPTVLKIVEAGTARLRALEQLRQDGYDVEFHTADPDTLDTRLAAADEKLTPADRAKYVEQAKEVIGRQEQGVEDLRAAKQLYNFMVRSQQLEAKSIKGIELAGQVGYAWFLGYTPAFWLMNILQNPMIAMPHLGSKYGIARSSTEWLKAAQWFSKVRLDKLFDTSDRQTPFSVEYLREAVQKGKLEGITKAELDMLQRLEDRQVLDFTQAMDLARVAEASNSTWYKALRLGAAGAHHTEVFNRVTLALAAYRLALRSRTDVTHEDAVRAAERDVAATHFDYSAENKPVLFRNNAARLVLMFQQYRQHVLYWWGQNIKAAIQNEAPGDRSRALKAMLLMGTTQGLFAGALGLPAMGSIAFLANIVAGLAGSAGDEPFDFERWLREAAVGATGSEKAADVMLKGVFSLAGMDISKRIGQGDVIPFLSEGSARFEQNADDKVRAYLADLLGPLGSIAIGAGRMVEAFQAGDYARGLAAGMPKVLADATKAWDLQANGLRDKRGNVLAQAEAFDGLDAALQLAGVAPRDVSNVKQSRGAVLDIQHELGDQKKQLTNAVVEAVVRHDQQGLRDALEQVQKYNANVAKGRLRDPQLLITPDKINAAALDRARRMMLLALTGGLADTRQQLLVAARMSGLYDLGGRDQRMEALGQRLDSTGLPTLPGLGGQ